MFGYSSEIMDVMDGMDFMDGMDAMDFMDFMDKLHKNLPPLSTINYPLSTINYPLSTKSHHFFYKIDDHVAYGDMALLNPVCTARMRHDDGEVGVLPYGTAVTA